MMAEDASLGGGRNVCVHVSSTRWCTYPARAIRSRARASVPPDRGYTRPFGALRIALGGSVGMARGIPPSGRSGERTQGRMLASYRAIAEARSA
jgi:hypothetical protein